MKFEPAGRRIGDYQLGQVIGGGGMGKVYLARQISMNRIVALKVLHQELSANQNSLDRFFQEMRFLAKLSHSGIVQVYEAGMDGIFAFFSMDYVDGSDLRTVLTMKGPFEEKEALRIAAGICQVMEYAWDKHHLIHRDIKPGNIMLTKNGDVRLLDLGISKMLTTDNAAQSNLTSVRFMVGSPTYMSPEQAYDPQTVDCRSDIYSLGVTLYHLLAGDVPYHAESQMEVLSQHCHSAVPDIRKKRPEISVETRNLIRDMMAKRVKDRPESWGILHKRILEIMQKPVAPKKERSPRKRVPWMRVGIIIAAVIAGLSLLTIALSLFFRSPDNKELPRSVNTAGGGRIGQVVGDPEQLREQELDQLMRSSSALEERKEYKRALSLWQNYNPPSVLKEDTEMQRAIQTQIKYLQDKIRNQEMQPE